MRPEHKKKRKKKRVIIVKSLVIIPNQERKLARPRIKIK
jgi:hypothetical protein